MQANIVATINTLLSVLQKGTHSDNTVLSDLQRVRPCPEGNTELSDLETCAHALQAILHVRPAEVCSLGRVMKPKKSLGILALCFFVDLIYIKTG